MSKVDDIVEALQRETRGALRVDTHGPGPCRWFRLNRRGSAEPLSLYRVWRLTQDSARHAEIHATEKVIAQAVRVAQQKLPLLSFEEWAQPRRRAA